MTQPSLAVETAIAQCTSRRAMARGHRLNTSIVLTAVHGLSGLFWAVSAVEPSLSPPLSPSLISKLTSVDVKQHGQGQAGGSHLPISVSSACIEAVLCFDQVRHVASKLNCHLFNCCVDYALMYA